MLKKLLLVVSLALVSVACGGDDDSGETDCVSAFLCAAECETDACVQGCIDDASKTAKAQMIELAECAEDAGCDGDDADECLEESCGAELSACLN